MRVQIREMASVAMDGRRDGGHSGWPGWQPQSREFSAIQAADSCAPVASVEADAEEIPLVIPSVSKIGSGCPGRNSDNE